MQNRTDSFDGKKWELDLRKPLPGRQEGPVWIPSGEKETSWASAVSTELKSKRRAWPTSFIVGKNKSQKLIQPPTNFGLTRYAKFAIKVVNPKQRLLSKHFYVEFHIFRLLFDPFPFSIHATIFIAVDAAQQNKSCTGGISIEINGLLGTWWFFLQNSEESMEPVWTLMKNNKEQFPFMCYHCIGRSLERGIAVCVIRWLKSACQGSIKNVRVWGGKVYTRFQSLLSSK